MTTSDCSTEAAQLSLLARALLFVSIMLSGVLFGYGAMGMGDSNWIQITVEVAVPAFLLVSVGYTFVEGSAS